MLILYFADAEKDVSMKNLSRKEALRKGEKMDTVSRQAAIDIVKSRKTAEQCEKGVVRNWAVDLCVDALEKLPSAEPERKTGHWVKSDMQRWYDVWLCSECGEKTDSAVMSKPRYKYCPMCGAKMERGDIE